jgi:hypothetical protein
MVSTDDRRAFYRELMARFVRGEIDGTTFKERFIERHSAETRAAVDRTNRIDAEFHVAIQKRLMRKEISGEEFERLWKERFGITDEEWALDSVLGDVFEVTDLFLHDPSLEVRLPKTLTEEELRAYVADVLAKHAALLG